MTNVLVLETHADAYAAILQERFSDLEVQVARSQSDDHVDYGKVEVLIAFGLGITEALFTRMPKLKWVQSLATGVDYFLRNKTLAQHVLLTSGRGIHGPPLRETVLHLMLSISHDSNGLVRDKTSRRWDRRAWPLLAGKTAVVVGTGVAGAAIGYLLKAMDMRVIGVSQTPRTVPGFDEVVPRRELPNVAAAADYVINVLPGDVANRKIVDGNVFAHMKPSAYFINVGRGDTVDEQAMIRALRERDIAGAGLDVFTTEPLPGESPLWDLPNVFMSPHVGGLFTEYQQMAMPLIIRNMTAYLADRLDQMTNVIDRSGNAT
ncbi:D-2-hydroxyacid dehydrogenase [Bradyrhizobium brasilense]|uniref:D-2-hydroxyacid dehydrogenase n=1 Tax=Bradyrhizobium brasilense TaxID=1419277 RepID=UPI001E296E90|nr:D-2-hydroxyacid dehydrogenase [Bradyrhizobium brasilense]MCC8969137.1 D-2-hydroxyacid dehydrogenase [Bradyrhizobium brasilense]